MYMYMYKYTNTICSCISRPTGTGICLGTYTCIYI